MVMVMVTVNIEMNIFHKKIFLKHFLYLGFGSGLSGAYGPPSPVYGPPASSRVVGKYYDDIVYTKHVELKIF